MPPLLTEVSSLTEENPVDMTPEVGEESHNRAFVVRALHPVVYRPGFARSRYENERPTLLSNTRNNS